MKLVFLSKARVTLLLLSALAASLVIVLTGSHGPGLSPDSTAYITAARSILNGEPLLRYGEPWVLWPPLYPALLALVAAITGTDPLALAHIVNAVLFGAIVYLAGDLIVGRLPNLPLIGIFAATGLVLAWPLLDISTMVWSEPLFIALSLLCIALAIRYLTRRDPTSLLLLALAIALAALTRYSGIILIAWGIVLIIGFRQDNWRQTTLSVVLFSVVSTLPIGLWVIRNVIVSGTLIGSRNPSNYTLFQNVRFTFSTISTWFAPYSSDTYRLALMAVLTTVVLLGFFLAIRHRRQQQLQSFEIITLLFVILYMTFLILSATTNNFDRIDDRLLTPIYIPLILTLFVGTWLCISQTFPDRVPPKYLQFVLLCGAALWISSTAITTYPLLGMFAAGRGYNSPDWQDSAIVGYLRDEGLPGNGCAVYTNAPDVLNTLVGIAGKYSPAKGSLNVESEWPPEEDVCLVWFEQVTRAYLLSPQELGAIVTLEPAATFSDGTIYYLLPAAQGSSLDPELVH